MAGKVDRAASPRRRSAAAAQSQAGRQKEKERSPSPRRTSAAKPQAKSFATQPDGRAIPPESPSRPLELLSLLVFMLAAIFAALSYKHGARSQHVTSHLILLAAVSVAVFFATMRVIPVCVSYHMRKNLVGRDINKKGTQGGEGSVPEAIGLAPGIVLVSGALVYQTLMLTLRTDTTPYDEAWHMEFNAGVVSVLFMVLLGFVDDVLDIPWRAKIVLPVFSALPLLASYRHGTDVVVPPPLRAYVPEVPGISVDGILYLGPIYKFYMVLVVVFCSNSINILAGCNGVEAGQSFVIGVGALVLNLLNVCSDDKNTAANHMLSASMLAPFLAATYALLMHNWYPSRVFVGDTYTYLAGMCLGAAGVLGHFSETMLIFFAPQVFNFIYSVPQLLKIVPCPRHRLPTFDTKTGLLTATPNYNLINLLLHIFGPCTEKDLTIRVLVVQVLSIAFGFGVRRALYELGWVL